jgi:hypothetical protein
MPQKESTVWPTFTHATRELDALQGALCSRHAVAARRVRGATVPAVYGLALGIDHIVPVLMPQPILKAVTAWFRIQLADDKAAGPFFYDTCTLCSDPSWRIKSANL